MKWKKQGIEKYIGIWNHFMKIFEKKTLTKYLLQTYICNENKNMDWIHVTSEGLPPEKGGNPYTNREMMGFQL